jgi:choline dehydrogenase
VIVKAGATGGPMLILLPGMGPAADLAAQGIAVVQGLPAAMQHVNVHFRTDIVASGSCQCA